MLSRVVVILLNFEILGEMDASPKKQPTAPLNQPIKQIQNENIEPNKPLNQSNTKSFFNQKETDFEKPQSNNPPGTFNGFKIFGISSLNPYQNK